MDDKKSKLAITLIDEIQNITNRTFLITTTQNIDRLDNEFRKYLDYTITINPPTQQERKKIFVKLTKDLRHNLTDDDYEVIADKSHGFVPGDIIQVLKSSLIESDELTRQRIENSLKEIKPISLKDIIIDIPKILWSDIGGNKDLINKIRQSIEWPLKHPEAFKRIGILPPNV